MRLIIYVMEWSGVVLSILHPHCFAKQIHYRWQRLWIVRSVFTRVSTCVLSCAQSQEVRADWKFATQSVVAKQLRGRATLRKRTNSSAFRSFVGTYRRRRGPTSAQAEATSWKFNGLPILLNYLFSLTTTRWCGLFSSRGGMGWEFGGVFGSRFTVVIRTIFAYVWSAVSALRVGKAPVVIRLWMFHVSIYSVLEGG